MSARPVTERVGLVAQSLSGRRWMWPGNTSSSVLISDCNKQLDPWALQAQLSTDRELSAAVVKSAWEGRPGAVFFTLQRRAVTQHKVLLAFCITILRLKEVYGSAEVLTLRVMRTNSIFQFAMAV